MIVKDEEDWVEGAIQSVRSIVDEVIIVDTGSTDRTHGVAGVGAKSFKIQSKDCGLPQNVALLQRFSQAARKRALPQYTWGRIASEWTAVLEALPAQPVHARLSGPLTLLQKTHDYLRNGNGSASARVLAALDRTPFLRNEVEALKGQVKHMDVTINENRIDIPPDLSTWGDLLDWLETNYLKAGQCITHVYMGGDEAMNYRDNYVCGQDIQSIGKIAVRSGDFDEVVHDSLAELECELKNAAVSTQRIIRLFENRQEADAYNELAELLDAIRIFYIVFSEDLGWATLSDSEISNPDFASALEGALQQLIAAQENRYWVSICDVLEYEITPIIESWNRVVERTRAHIN